MLIRLLFLAATAVQLGWAQSPPTASPLTIEEVGVLAQARDYFTLRERIAEAKDRTDPAVLYAQSLVARAFNHLDESNAAIEAVRKRHGLPDTLLFRLATIAASNHLHQFHYSEGLAVADEALSRIPPGTDSALVTDFRNTRTILDVLKAVPPQQIYRKGPLAVRLEDGRIPITVNGSARRYIFDTGANLSVVSRSEAAALHLTIFKADIDVGSSTDVRNRADLAVAERVVLGGWEIRHVVFLVFDDALLTFPSIRILGIIGFPVINMLEEVRLQPGGMLTVPADPPQRTVHNLALESSTPLTRVEWRATPLLCRLDTGAGRTDIYEPFYQQFRSWVETTGHPDSVTSGGVGGIRTLPAFALPNLEVHIGDTTATLRAVSVYTRSIAAHESDNYLFCNIGHDVFDAFHEYIFNFRDMSFLLR